MHILCPLFCSCSIYLSSNHICHSSKYHNIFIGDHSYENLFIIFVQEAAVILLKSLHRGTFGIHTYKNGKEIYERGVEQSEPVTKAQSTQHTHSII